MKTCGKCGGLKPLESFYKDKSKADGRCYSCKACMGSISKAWGLANPEKTRAATRKWRLANPEKVRAAFRKWSLANPEKRHAAVRKWRFAHPEMDHAKARAWQAANPEKVRARARVWCKENPGKVNATTRRRRAAKLRAVPKWSERDKIMVVYQKASDLGFEVDHIVPLQSKVVCGLHVWSNLQLLSSAENVKKSNRTWPDMWPERKAA